MTNDFLKELKGFNEVWRRVQQSQGLVPDKLSLMPRKAQKSAAVRFTKPEQRKL